MADDIKQPAKYKKRKLILAGMAVLILAVLFWNMDLARARDNVMNARPDYLLYAVGLMLTFPVLCAIRWELIVRQLGTRLGFWQSFIIVMAAWPLGAITPAKSGDLIKLMFLKNVFRYSQTTGVILAERMMDLVALSLYGTIGAIVYGLHQAGTITGAMLAGVIAFFLIAASPAVKWIPGKWQKIVVDVLEASKRIYLNPITFLGTLAVTLLNWFCTFLQTWCCYKAFQTDVPMSYIVAVLPLAIFIGLIPVTLSGMGTRDSAIAAFFSKYASYETNISVGILYSIFGYWLLSLMGVPFLKLAMSGRIRHIQGEAIRDIVYQQPDAHQ